MNCDNKNIGDKVSKPLFTYDDFIEVVEFDIQAETCADIANEKLEALTSLFSVQLDMHDKIELLERKLALAIEQRDRHLEDYLMPDNQKAFFDKEIEDVK